MTAGDIMAGGSVMEEGHPMSETRRNVDLAPADYIDPVIEAYKKDVDRTLLRENLKLKPCTLIPPL
jgi:hypothetical protein